MKSRMPKIVIGAIIVITCIASLLMWTSTGSRVALADVLTRVQQVSVYMYQMTISTTGTIDDNEPLEQEIRATVLMSQDLGMKMTTQMDMSLLDGDNGEPEIDEMYMLAQQKRMVTIIPGQKKYMEIDCSDVQFEEMQMENNDPGAMVKEILQCDYTSLGRSTIDGIEVEGFQTTDPNYLGEMLCAVDIKIWVDVKTQLPVRSEMDIQMGKDMHSHIVVHDFQWDVSVAASEFEPVIPDDYTPLTDEPIKLPDFNEETALQGLKLFADLSGAYPEKLDLMALLSQAGELATKNLPTSKELIEQGKELDVEARTQEFMEVTRPVQSLAMFYTLLVAEQKDPTYYGDIVTPEDEDQVLMRWKVSDTEYRVIFGSLRAETVTADVLARLEENLPK